MWKGRFMRLAGTERSSVTQRELPPTWRGASETTDCLRKGAPPFYKHEMGSLALPLASQSISLMAPTQAFLPMRSHPKLKQTVLPPACPSFPPH